MLGLALYSYLFIFDINADNRLDA